MAETLESGTGKVHRTSRFVGRDSELRLLLDHFEAAAQGRGQAVLVQGEVGIGKTELLRAFCDKTRMKGASTSWFSCSHLSDPPPYWPIAQLLKTSKLAETDAAVRTLKDLAPGRETAGQPTLNVAVAFDRVLGAILEVPASEALVLVLDGGENLDSHSVQLLQLLEQHIMDRPVMLVVGTKSGKVGHIEFADTLQIGGLSLEATHQLVESLCQLSPPEALVQRIHELAGGNPSFITEIMDDLLNSGQLSVQDNDYWPATIFVPDRIRHRFHAELDGLSPACGNALAMASVIGCEFDYRVLAAMAARQRCEADLESLEEAEVAGLIKPDAENGSLFTFSHVLLRETLYDDLPTTRRFRLHGDIARALVDCFGPPATPDALSVFAHHIERGRLANGVEKVVAYAEQGAREARRRSDFEAEVAFLQIAMSSLEARRGSFDPSTIDLALSLSEAQSKAGDFEEAIETARKTWSWAEFTNDPERLARAALAVEEARWQPGMPGRISIPLIRTALERLPDTDTALRARLLCHLGQAIASDLGNGDGVRFSLEGLAMARRLGEPDLLVEALGAANMALRHDPTQHGKHGKMIEHSREFVSLAMAGSDPNVQAYAYSGWCIGMAETGDGKELRAAVEKFETLAVLCGSPHYLYQLKLHKFSLALQAGRFADAPGLAIAAREEGARLRGADSEGVFGIQMFALNRELGRLAQFAPLMSSMELDAPGSSVWRPGLALLQAEIGQADAASRLLEELAGNRFALIPRDDLWLVSLAFLSDVRLLISHQDSFARELIAELEPYRHLMVAVLPGAASFGPTRRLLGGLHNLVGNYDLARTHFETALDQANEMESPPILARCRHDYVQALFREGTPSAIRRADELLDGLDKDIAHLGMQSLLERTEALMERRRQMSRTFGIDDLTPRELEVLRLLAAGMTNSEISAQLSVSRATIATHVRNILSKTNCPNRTAAVAFAREMKIIVT